MAAIRESLVMEDYFSAAFTSYINMGDRAAGATERAEMATQNYQAVLNSLDRKLISLNGQFAAALQEQEAMTAVGMQNTAAFAELDERMERLGATIRNLNAQYDAVSEDADRAAAASKGSSEAFRQTDQEADQLTSTLKRLAASYVSIQGLKNLISTADTMSQITARLDQMNDGMQTTQELQDMIYQSAMRSRGAYADTADFVAKLGTLAPDAFSSNTELIAFAEQINKQMALSGASAAGQQAAMLQLTQALASGVLRGEELNSVLEQTPMIAKTIAGYMGVTVGEMRAMAAEGVITADVVKNAMLGAAAETNEAFEGIPLTWEQLATQGTNILLNGFQPFLGFVSAIPQMIVDNYQIVLALFVGLAAVIAVVGVQAMISGAATAGAFLMANWPILLILGGVSAITYGLLQAGYTASDMGEMVGDIFGWLYAFVGNGVVNLYNLWASFAEFFANVFDDPVRAAANLFFDFIDTILGLLQTAAGAIDTVFGSNLGGIVSGWRADLSHWVSDTIGDNNIQITRMDYIDYSSAMAQFGDFGRSLADSIVDFSAGGIGDMPTFSVPSYDELAGTLDDISGDTSALRKEVALEKEDIKSMVDLMERRYVNYINLTAQTPVITVNGANTGDSPADRRALADTIRDILVEQAAAASLLTTGRAF